MDASMVSSTFARKMKAIATDMDGTFFSTGLSILESTITAYRRAVASGVPIIPSTGRIIEGVTDALKRAQIEDVKLFPGVYLNGCLTYGPGGPTDIICEHHLSKGVIKQMLDFTKKLNTEWTSQPNWESHPLIKNATPEHGFYAVVNPSLKPVVVSVAAYAEGGIIYDDENQLNDGLKQFKEGSLRKVNCLYEYVLSNKPIHKLLFLTHCGPLMAIFRKDLDSLVGTEVTLSAGIPRILEVTPKGVNKAEALALLLNCLGFSLDNVAAIGDGENDIEMLKEVGFSIAMGNGSDKVKAVAHVITDTNDQHGWSMAINSLIDAKFNSTS